MKRQRSIPFKIYLTPEENRIIQARVEAAGISRSQYGHLALTSPFVAQLQQAEREEKDIRDLYLLLGQHYTTLSLIESNLAALMPQRKVCDCRSLLEQLNTKLNQVQLEVRSLAQQLRSR